MKPLLFLLLLTGALSAGAQNLTGTWLGETLPGDYIRIEMIHAGDSLYGMVYDEGANGFCIANFAGVYRKRSRRIEGRTISFIDRTPNHVLTDFNLQYRKKFGAAYLKGTTRPLIAASDPVRWPDMAVELRKQSDRVDTTAFMKAHIEVPQTPAPGTGEKAPASAGQNMLYKALHISAGYKRHSAAPIF